MTIQRHSALFFSLLLGFVLSAQIDPRIPAVLGDLSVQQKHLLELKASMLEQRALLKNNSTDKTSKSHAQDSLEESDLNDQIEEKEDGVDALQQLIFFESLLLNDLESLRNEEAVGGEQRKSSSEENLRRIEALEQVNRLLFEIKKMQRDEIERRSVELTEVQAVPLKPFGLEFFSNAKEIQLDQMSLVPSNYQVGPGDVLEILLYGQRNEAFSLLVNRDGIIQFPNIGPINVFEHGRGFIKLKNAIQAKIKEFVGEGVQASISLGALKSVSVTVVGQVASPGTYMVPPFSSVTTAIRLAGGIAENGSMRKISLIRGEAKMAFDMYDLLLDGDLSSDQLLIAGDVVFVSPLEGQVAVSGAVNQPALFELTDSVELDALLRMAGGISFQGYAQIIKLERRNQFGRYDLIQLDASEDSKFRIIPGDIVTVTETQQRFLEAVEILGPVERPGFYQWKKGLRLSDVLKESGSLLDHGDLRFAYLVRQDEFRELSVYAFSPGEVLSQKASFALMPNDRVILLSNRSLPERLTDIRRVLLDLRKQTPNSLEARVVTILGEVHFPGDYLLAEDMTVRQLILAAGGLKDSAFEVGAELTRLKLDKDNYNTIEHVRIKPQEYLDFNDSQDHFLKPYDTIFIKPTPFWSAGQSVVIQGEVKFPGVYRIKKGETLKAVMDRAGGLTENAFPDGAFFSRKVLLEKEQAEKQRMIMQLEGDLANATLDSINPQEAARSQAAAKAMLSKLKSSEPTGRLVIDLANLLKKDSRDLILKDGDSLVVPATPSAVSVMGEVLFPTSHLHDSKYAISDYLNMSGGFSANADKDRIFVVKANGSVFAEKKSKWFVSSKGSLGELCPGDVIVVPIDVQQSRFLEQLSYSSQIIYQMAVAAAAVNSF